MTRFVLYPENMASHDGRILSNTHTEDGPIPLLLMPDVSHDGHDGSRIIGYLTSIRRITLDSIHAPTPYVFITALSSIPLEQYVGYSPEPDFTGGQFSDAGGGSVFIDGARLVSVTLGHKPCWSGLEIVA